MQRISLAVAVPCFEFDLSGIVLRQHRTLNIIPHPACTCNIASYFDTFVDWCRTSGLVDTEAAAREETYYITPMSLPGAPFRFYSLLARYYSGRYGRRVPAISITTAERGIKAYVNGSILSM